MVIRVAQPPRAHRNDSGQAGSHSVFWLSVAVLARTASWAQVTSVGRVVGTNTDANGLRVAVVGATTVGTGMGPWRKDPKGMNDGAEVEAGMGPRSFVEEITGADSEAESQTRVEGGTAAGAGWADLVSSLPLLTNSRPIPLSSTRVVSISSPERLSSLTFGRVDVFTKNAMKSIECHPMNKGQHRHTSRLETRRAPSPSSPIHCRTPRESSRPAPGDRRPVRVPLPRHICAGG